MGIEQIFSVGMTKKQVLAKLDQTQVTDKTKQYIQNFWATDLDGKVTNEIELAMLDSWASGSEKVKMPEIKAKRIESDEVNLSEVRSHYRSASGGDLYTYFQYPDTRVNERGEKYRIMMGENRIYWTDGKNNDELVDKNWDGYADYRRLEINYKKNWEKDAPPENYIKEDTKMDGLLKAWEPKDMWF